MLHTSEGCAGIYSIMWANRKNNSPTLRREIRDQISHFRPFPFQRTTELTSLISCLAHHPFPIWSLLLTLTLQGSTLLEDCDPNWSIIKFLIAQLTQELVISGCEAWRECFIKTGNLKLYKRCHLKRTKDGFCVMLIRTGTKYTSWLKKIGVSASVWFLHGE